MQNPALTIILLLCFSSGFMAQVADTTKLAEQKGSGISDLKLKLNSSGTHYFQVTFLNQVWLRYSENNPGSTRFSRDAPTTFDVGLRRTRVQLFGQLSDRAFIYFQFGQNNFNSAYNYTGNRKVAAFFHDAICEYKLTGGNQLKLGAGLTVLNGLSRFSQPSVGSIMTMDVPVFLQYSVDQTDQFDRRLAVYARGQLGKFDYRVYLSNPFPVSSNGAPPPPLSMNASFVNTASLPNGYGPGINNQLGAYFAYNFFENEPHTTPYMTGTYLGSKKVWNIAMGAVYQNDATWNLSTNSLGILADTVYHNMVHVSLESFLDVPLNKEKGTAINAFAGLYNTNYGKDYLRYNGIMNPATGSTDTNMVQSIAYGNSFPMFGTGVVAYAQLGILLPKTLLGENSGQLMPYLSAQVAEFTALKNKNMLVLNAGCNWLISAHRSKLSLDYQYRPTYSMNSAGTLYDGPGKSCVIMQYQIFF